MSTTRTDVDGLYDTVPAGVRPAILLGAHAGLRLAEAAALRVEDVDFATGLVSPMVQWVDEPLKSEKSRTPIPIPKEMAHLLAEAVSAGNGRTLVDDEWGNPAGPWTIERAIRAAREQVGLPAASVSMTCGTRRRRRPWTPTVTSGRIGTTVRALRWQPSTGSEKDARRSPELKSRSRSMPSS